MSISVANNVAFPAALRFNVKFLHCATGAMRSTTITVALQVEKFPLGSVIVNVTVFAPKLAQLKLDLLIVLVKEQLSDEPKSISVARSMALPEAFRFNVKGLQSATGAIASTTVTVAV
ncbi:hypothetical protein, partial [Flavobacterium alvei]|uniref:hypothetical protein n=1 Tax=Flavobacterium alvei TaxID=2080416 RepID=UPI0026F21562